MAIALLHAILFAIIAIGLTDAQQAGQYFRPSGDQVSGVPNSRAQFLRSPCPALNTLANHGIIPRDGRRLTPLMLRNAVMQAFNVDAALANLQVSALPFILTLADLSQHNFIEHDASLVHADAFYRQDPSQVDGGLVNDLLSRANNGMLGINEVGEALRVRLIWCQQKPVGCSFGESQRTITFREAATFMQVFGGKNGAQISMQHAYSFMVLEQFPADWRRPTSQVTLSELESISQQIQVAAGVATGGVVAGGAATGGGNSFGFRRFGRLFGL